MLEIRIKPSTVKVKRLVARLERGDDVLSDVASREVVKQARRLAPTHLRTKILRRKMGRPPPSRTDRRRQARTAP